MSFGITDPDRMRQILRVFSLLDAIRWKETGNYGLINYCASDLTPDEKILTHWMCYITDRQMPFRRVFDIGGYVLSHLSREYTRGGGGVRELLSGRVQSVEGQGKLRVSLACGLEGTNQRLRRYGFSGERVRFASRYMPDDIVLIFRTLALLDALSGRSLARFIAEAGAGVGDRRLGIQRVASALDRLTYSATRARSARNLWPEIDKMAEQVNKEVAEFREDRALSLEKWCKPAEHFGNKRLWCYLRDLLKSPEFNEAFVKALERAGVADATSWRRDTPVLLGALGVMQLPGDVWNNRGVFRHGLFAPYLRDLRSSWDMPRTVRKIHDILSEEGPPGFYPEQLDVTFDFVPRMCEGQLCGACFFGKGISRVCHQSAGLLCSPALLACGYSHGCDPATCELKSDSVKGFCRSSICG